MNGFLNVHIREKLKVKSYRAIDVTLSLMCGFINRMIGYTTLPRMARVYAMYRLSMSQILSSTWSRKWAREELNSICAELREFEKEVEKLSSSAGT